MAGQKYLPERRPKTGNEDVVDPKKLKKIVALKYERFCEYRKDLSVPTYGRFNQLRFHGGWQNFEGEANG